MATAQEAIFYPFGAAALLTFVVLATIPFRRIAAVRRGTLTPGDFRMGESDRVPAAVALTNRNYMNLLELPTLFYPICLAYYATGRVGAATLTLAWAYVALRVTHSAIHLGYNNVIHRLVVFALGNVALGGLWIAFFM